MPEAILHRAGPHHFHREGHPLMVDPDGFGIISPDAEHAFTAGQCHALGLALHEATGWPIVVDAPVPVIHQWGHVCVLHPDGDLVDIYGKQPPEAKVGAYGWEGYHEIDPEDVPALPYAFDIPDWAMETARCFARTVLRDLED